MTYFALDPMLVYTVAVPPMLIRPPLDHTFLVAGLALTMMSVTYLVIPVAGRLLVGWP
jgi:hypothetical protein